MPRSFALGDHFEAFIEAQLESGRYNNASEVVRDGLRLLEDYETIREVRTAELRHMVEDARRDGRLIPAAQLFDRLEAKYKALADKTPDLA
jgi:antitoxin ParD1/3/4